MKIRSFTLLCPQTLLKFHQFYMNSLVCMSACILLWNFITCLDLYNHQHNQDIGLFYHHRDVSPAIPLLSPSALHDP